MEESGGDAREGRTKAYSIGGALHAGARHRTVRVMPRHYLRQLALDILLVGVRLNEFASDTTFRRVGTLVLLPLRSPCLD